MAVARTFSLIVIVGVLIFVGAVSLGGMAVYSKQSSFCASCKIMQTRYVGWERSTHARSIHAKADCITCHSEPGIIGEFKAHLNGARYVVARLTRGKGARSSEEKFTRGPVRNATKSPTSGQRTRAMKSIMLPIWPTIWSASNATKTLLMAPCWETLE